MKDPRSYLFVPGLRPDRCQKAAACGADAIILDLEDAVGRTPRMRHAATSGTGSCWGAGAGADSPWHEDDLAVLEEMPEVAVMMPKAEPVAVARIAARLPNRPLIALVETVVGLAGLRDTARLDNVERIAFGNLDFGSDARIPEGSSAFDPARFEIVLASRLGGLAAPVDGVTTLLMDAEVIDRDVRRAREMGFGAKLCIHPAQVAPVNEGLAPTSTEIEWAQRILAALEAASGSVVQVDGKMVDRPVIDRARQILQDSGAEMPWS